ncbi:MAG: hypothetical protein ACKO6E_03465 [Planctomycetota bacterium]
MKNTMPGSWATSAILAVAEIKTALEAFDRGESNVHDALDAIVVALEAHQAVHRLAFRRRRPHSDAASRASW